MNKKNKILSFIILLWIGIALVRTLYNFSKIITEEKNWIYLTTEQKKEKQFGDRHLFFRFVKANIPSGSNILFDTNDGMAYYLARYYLYPTTVIWEQRQFSEWGNGINRNYNYVINYPITSEIKNNIVVNKSYYKRYRIYIVGNDVRGIIYKK